MKTGKACNGAAVHKALNTGESASSYSGISKEYDSAKLVKLNSFWLCQDEEGVFSEIENKELKEPCCPYVPTSIISRVTSKVTVRPNISMI
jgi:hypothetical protein